MDFHDWCAPLVSLYIPMGNFDYSYVIHSLCVYIWLLTNTNDKEKEIKVITILHYPRYQICIFHFYTFSEGIYKIHSIKIPNMFYIEICIFVDITCEGHK